MTTQPNSDHRKVVAGFYGPASLEQRAFYDMPGTVNILVCGSKAGKTFCLTNWICAQAWGSERPFHAAWGSPYRNQLNQSFGLAMRLFPRDYVVINKSEKEIYIPHNDSTIRWIPLESDPEAMESMGNDVVVLDEASKLKHQAFISARTTITQTAGKIVIITTPRGQSNWVYREYNKGVQGELGYSVHNLPSFINPTVSVEMLKKQRASLPWDAYRQYILGEFLEGAGSSVFRDVPLAWHPVDDAWGWRRPNNALRYFIGVDLARLNDYSVMTVVELDPLGETVRVVDWKRAPHLDWSTQKRMVEELYERWNRAGIIMDATGVGQPIAEDLASRGLPVHEFALNHHRKKMLVERLQISFERRVLLLPDLPEVRNVLDYELGQYEYTLTPSGLVGFSASGQGVHDDAVISLALANFAACNLASGASLHDLGLQAEDSILRKRETNSYKPRQRGRGFMGTDY